ncbi:5-oxoprolinase subunit PxpB [Cytobacillus gottheilii]|uniref:5-oxoprolinase subunit PxpB n=1 Tax=Cytobacillus gottheilii TaxID=859144 RepID=UPI001594ACDC|nr:5-oxoprolinase subunit PxpB [Cytobacillus gottheilii]
MKDHKILPTVMQTGERSIRFSFGDEISDGVFRQIRWFCDLIENNKAFDVEDVVPSYTTVHVYLASANPLPLNWGYELFELWNRLDFKQMKLTNAFKRIEIPVCYDPAFALDLQRVVDHTNLTEKEIIQSHTAASYAVYAIGFLPGFPYLGGLQPELATPRLKVPRERVEEGTVGIGGAQTGVYPVGSPGGWNIIGRTPLSLYDPNRTIPFLCSAGDIVNFKSISIEKYTEIKEQLLHHPDDIQQWIT